MIKNFKENPVRDTGVINKGMFEQVKLLHSQNPQLAGELAISLMELVLTGEYSSDDFMVQFAMANHSIIVERNKEKYEKKVEATAQARIEKLQLDKIAEMLKKGKLQKDIALALGESKQVISARVKILRTEFPELLEEAELEEVVSQKSQKSQESQTDDNDNDNDNDNDISFAPSSQNWGCPPSPAPEAPSNCMKANSRTEFAKMWGMGK